jgi:hypothetical protein
VEKLMNAYFIRLLPIVPARRNRGLQGHHLVLTG